MGFELPRISQRILFTSGFQRTGFVAGRVQAAYLYPLSLMQVVKGKVPLKWDKTVVSRRRLRVHASPVGELDPVLKTTTREQSAEVSHEVYYSRSG
jgi:hypothetical protein